MDTSAAQKPASSRILWALRCATKIDYRDKKLTMEQAQQLLREANEKSGYGQTLPNIVPAPAKIVKSAPLQPRANKYGGNKQSTAKKNLSVGTMFLQYATNNVDRLIHCFREECSLVGTLSNDPMCSTDTKPKWVMVGSGCGFAWLEYRKIDSYKQLERACQAQKATIDKLVQKELGKEFCNHLQKIGNPIQALQMQNERYNLTWCWIVADFMRMQGVKRVGVNSRLD